MPNIKEEITEPEVYNDSGGICDEPKFNVPHFHGDQGYVGANSWVPSMVF